MILENIKFLKMFSSMTPEKKNTQDNSSRLGRKGVA